MRIALGTAGDILGRGLMLKLHLAKGTKAQQ